MSFRVEPFDKARHDRTGFRCGEASLDEYLARQASQDVRRDLASLFCMVEDGATTIAGFYTLCSSSLPLHDLPAEHARRLPHYADIPAVLLGRLAIHADLHGKGLGGALLVDALERSLALGVATWCVLVDALHDRAATWYRRYGFEPLPGQPLRLIIPAATIRRLSPAR